MNYKANIGRRVTKGSISTGDANNKKFKSGLLINTVKDVIDHPVLHIPAYTFEEDDSYVECRRCFLANTHVVIDLVYHEDEGNEVFEGTQQECLDWVDEQCMAGGSHFTYEVKPIIRK
jgi:hypothetical protein